MIKRKDISRRRFLKNATDFTAGAIAFPYIVSSSALGNAGNVAASNRIVMGCIGMGGMGTSIRASETRPKRTLMRSTKITTAKRTWIFGM